MRKIDRLPLGRAVSCLLLSSLFSPVASVCRGADVTAYGIVKYELYYQDNPNIVRMLLGPGRVELEAAVALSFPNAVPAATLQKPGGTPQPMGLYAGGMVRALGEDVNYETRRDLDAAYPNGAYRFQMTTTNDGEKTILLELNGNAYPNIPKITNYASLQSVDAGDALTVTWTPFSGGTIYDHIELQIRQSPDAPQPAWNVTEHAWGDAVEVWTSGYPGDPDALDGTETSVEVPADTLEPGKQYVARLYFRKWVDMDDASYGPGVIGAAGYGSSTELWIQTTGAETDPPALLRVIPVNDESAASRNSAVAFYFDEPMAAGIDIAWTGTGIDPDHFCYAWNPDKTILHAHYQGGFPALTQIGWTLNAPPGGPPFFEDEAGNDLPTGSSGSFATSDQPETIPADLWNFNLQKREQFVQDGDTPEGPFNFTFGARLEGTGMNTVVDAAVKSSVGTVHLATIYEGEIRGGRTRNYDAAYFTKAQMDACFPSGDYDVTFQTLHDGSRTATLSLGPDDYPNTPTITGLSSLQAIDSSAPFTVSWSGRTPGTYVYLQITNQYGQMIYQAGAGTSDSWVIPAGILSPGRSYTAWVDFFKTVDYDGTSYPDAGLTADYTRETQFALATAGPPFSPTPELTMVGDEAQLNIEGEQWWYYNLEASTDLIHWHFINQVWTGETGEGSGSDSDAQYLGRRFYRFSDAETYPYDRSGTPDFRSRALFATHP